MLHLICESATPFDREAKISGGHVPEAGIHNPSQDEKSDMISAVVRYSSGSEEGAVGARRRPIRSGVGDPLSAHWSPRPSRSTDTRRSAISPRLATARSFDRDGSETSKNVVLQPES